MRRALPVAVAAVLLLGACSSDPDAEVRPRPSSSPSADAEQPAGTPARPASATVATDLLDWSRLPGQTTETVTTNGTWRLTISQEGDRAELTDGARTVTVQAGRGRRIDDGLLDDDWALVVAQDTKEERPAVATAIRLSDQERLTLDADSDVPTVSGGAWTLAEGHALHATRSQGAYCLADVDLGTGRGTVGYCAPDGEGFNSPVVSDAGVGLLTFDDASPSCRTVVTLDGGMAAREVSALSGVKRCQGWQALPTDDGAVWSSVPDAERVERAQYFAHAGDAWLALGAGTSGTLTWCAGSAFWTRDAERGDPARLMRWDGSRLSIAYAAPDGQGFIAPPRCAGSHLSITALTEGGDEQVSAKVA